MTRHRRAEVLTAASLLVLGSFQVALATGAPWGRAAYGGRRHGTLPRDLRAASGVAAVVYGAAATLAVADVGSPATRRRAFSGLSLVMGVGAVANAASRSSLERTLWTPLTMLSSAAAWWSRPAQETRVRLAIR